jgi:hypothetical protein
MAEVLAAMSPEAAERLTVALATRSVPAAAQHAAEQGATPPGELPRIDQPPPRASAPLPPRR